MVQEKTQISPNRQVKSFRLPPNLVARLKARAEIEERDQTDIVEDALVQYLDKTNIGLPGL